MRCVGKSVSRAKNSNVRKSWRMSVVEVHEWQQPHVQIGMERVAHATFADDGQFFVDNTAKRRVGEVDEFWRQV